MNYREALSQRVARLLTEAGYAPYRRGVLGIGERTGFRVTPLSHIPRKTETVAVSLTHSDRDLNADTMAALASMLASAHGYVAVLRAAGLNVLSEGGLVWVKAPAGAASLISPVLPEDQ